ncbi:MAG TPA: O-antigen ligase family protein [Candidatus Limnocylindrales bacterium]|nr:O-antigen ligase family protein [Candidatus Limnocylindrales bacterium]
MALWVPVCWLFICSSRNVSEWLHYSGDVQTNRYLEGNPLDRAFLTGLLLVAVLVLVRRGSRVLALLKANLPILLYFMYCGISFLWSDYPDVSFKRWFRALGDVVMILVVLSDTEWYEALKRFLTRVGFVVIPLSALFIRYFPELGRAYSRGGAPTWTGVCTDKNQLGITSALFGLASLYYLMELYRRPREERARGPRFAYGIIVLISVYLLYAANSATALSCFLLGGSLMVMTLLFQKARNGTILNLAVMLAILVPFSAMFLGIGSGLVENLGRNTTFTGRTAIWRCAIPMVGNPVIGEGFESFWLGQRLVDIEKCIDQGLNQAHNGYIEVYLNLGWLGVILLGILLVTGYRRTVAAARFQTRAGSLRLAYFVVAVAYDFSEGGFKMMNPVWICLLLAIAIVPATPSPATLDISSDGQDRRLSTRPGRIGPLGRNKLKEDVLRIERVRVKRGV